MVFVWIEIGDRMFSWAQELTQQKDKLSKESYHKLLEFLLVGAVAHYRQGLEDYPTLDKKTKTRIRRNIRSARKILLNQT